MTPVHVPVRADYQLGRLAHDFTSLITATSTGSLDSADGYPYLTVRPDDALVVSWANAIPGTIAFATIYYDEEPA